MKNVPSAATVSRILRTKGLNPVGTESRSREGIRVTRSLNGVRVWIDVDNRGEAIRLADDVRGILDETGYTYTYRGGDVVSFQVTGKEQEVG